MAHEIYCKFRFAYVFCDILVDFILLFRYVGAGPESKIGGQEIGGGEISRSKAAPL